jgi:hypothetical protein
METDTLKKILLYSGVAVVLGLVLTLVPLITLAEFRAENHYDATLYVQALPGQMKRLEGTYGSDKPAYSTADLQILGACFAIAVVVYVLFRRRIPLHDYRRPML